MHAEIIAMAQRAHDEDNLVHLKNLRDRLDALFDKVPTEEVMRLLNDVNNLLTQLRIERARIKHA